MPSGLLLALCLLFAVQKIVAALIRAVRRRTSPGDNTPVLSRLPSGMLTSLARITSVMSVDDDDDNDFDGAVAGVDTSNDKSGDVIKPMRHTVSSTDVSEYFDEAGDGKPLDTVAEREITEMVLDDASVADAAVPTVFGSSVFTTTNAGF
jgi:hypothetical protein